MRLFNGLAFRSPLHARALPNLQERALKAMRSVGLDSGTLDWTLHSGRGEEKKSYRYRLQ